VLLTSIYAARGDDEELDRLVARGQRLVDQRSHFRCACGFESSVMRWHCPECNRFDSFSPNSH
jgi:lipopolysaccharide biosynthesis regulator YciM